MAVALGRKQFVRAKPNQIKYLIDYMSDNLDMVRANTTPSYEVKWNQLKDDLNAIGPDKTIQQWKHTWRDLKKHARVEKMRYDEAANKGVTSELTSQTRAILDIAKRSGDDSFDAVSFDNTSFDNSNYCDNNEESDLPGDEDGEATEGKEKKAAAIEFLQVNPDVVLPVKKAHRRRQSISSTSSTEVERKKIKQETNSHEDHDYTSNDNCNNFTNGSDSGILNTLNKFIDYARERDQLAHEREMSRIAQNDKMLNLVRRMVIVLEDLAPSIKKCLSKPAATEL